MTQSGARALRTRELDARECGAQSRDDVNLRRSLGERGEEVAVADLRRRGWSIVDRNWRCSAGEVDIIAIDPDGVLAFVEVKCRSGVAFGTPLEAITRTKLGHMRAVAAAWLSAHHGAGGRPVRLDAIGVLIRRGYAPIIDHVRQVA